MWKIIRYYTKKNCQWKVKFIVNFERNESKTCLIRHMYNSFHCVIWCIFSFDLFSIFLCLNNLTSCLFWHKISLPALIGLEGFPVHRIMEMIYSSLNKRKLCMWFSKLCILFRLETTCDKTCWPCRWLRSWTDCGWRQAWIWRSSLLLVWLRDLKRVCYSVEV